MRMKPSRRCLDLVKGYEQCRLTAYMPTPDDVPTIGWGSTGPDIQLGMKWTQAKADARFSADISVFSYSVNRCLGKVPTTQNQFDALVSLAYNIGSKAFCSSTLLQLHKAGDFKGAAAQFGRWNKQKGKVLRGLTRRRAEEAALYLRRD